MTKAMSVGPVTGPGSGVTRQRHGPCAPPHAREVHSIRLYGVRRRAFTCREEDREEGCACVASASARTTLCRSVAETCFPPLPCACAGISAGAFLNHVVDASGYALRISSRVAWTSIAASPRNRRPASTPSVTAQWSSVRGRRSSSST